MTSIPSKEATSDEAFDLGWVSGYDAAMSEIASLRSAHPECQVHPDEDVVSCGWKKFVLELDSLLKGEV